ncbi:MAG: nitrite/sulfite reductase [candidate division NC10 bacterium]|nr:nitrite/sulfite reductase [candidate division NC10 bacterium]
MSEKSRGTERGRYLPGQEAGEVLDEGGSLAFRASFADEGEIDTFDEFVQRFFRGEIDPDEFRRFRLQNGIYGQRQEGEQMVRVKIPWGGLTADQLEVLASIAEETAREMGHVTTRQNMQFHFVKLERVPELMRRLAEVGLTTREACGNTIRNVTACHKAGVCPREAFDVTPYAEATARYFLRNPMNQNLPRKFKISFSGCEEDCGLPVIHDIGAVAVLRTEDGRTLRGFRLYLGGGLGPHPKAAQLLEEFTLEGELLVTLAAVVRLFDRHGNREDKNKARMKFVVEKLGFDVFRTLVLQERSQLKLTMAGRFPTIQVREEKPPANRALAFGTDPSIEGFGNGGEAYGRWLKTNVMPQKQGGYALVHVRLTLGDITAAQLKVLAFAAREFGDGSVRTTSQQNLALRWVPMERLPQLYRILSGVGLADPWAERLGDVTCCPGADTCQLGITSSRGLALAIGERFENGLKELADQAGIRIKISGCPNACGQHHIASIGFFGGARKFGDRQVPTYQMLLGGNLGKVGDAPYGKAFMKIPAKNIPLVVERLLLLYRDERVEGESFNAFLERYGLAKLREHLKKFAELPSFEEDPERYRDWGAEEGFSIKTGPGECAA